MTDTAFDLRHRDPIVGAPQVTPLEELADELGAVDPGKVTLMVDTRPGWAVVYSLGIDGPQLAAWRRAARNDMVDPPVLDDYLWYRTILAAQCKEIRKDGKLVADTAGKPLTFFSEDLWQLLHVPAGAPSGATEAVRRFYSNDFAIAGAADKLISGAGFGKQAKEAPDPTAGSSSS